MLWLSLGESCLPDALLKRHGKKSFSTPYSHGRSNVDFALKLESDGYDVLLYFSRLEVGDAFGDRVIRSKCITWSSPIFDASLRIGFDFTHHNVIANNDHRESISRKIERLKTLRGKEDVVFFYHHQYCSLSNIELLRDKLLDFMHYYPGIGVRVFVAFFYQDVTGCQNSRRVDISSNSNGLIECVFYTKNCWEGRDPNLFWALVDDDLVGEMIAKVGSIINTNKFLAQKKRCNICGSDQFVDFNARIEVQCASCKSLERHRLVRYTLEKLGYLSLETVHNHLHVISKRALHLAPEEMSHRYLAYYFGAGYICSDLVPSKYPHAQCLKLALPSGFDIFPDGYFDLILHNHVLEHIPGDYRDHLAQFVRILRPEGHMVFTVPGVSCATMTVQGGEHLSLDEDRLRLHGQSDHYKSFGYDLIDWFNSASGKFGPMEIPDDIRATLCAPADSIFVYLKS
jgi:hypothetical protein